MTSTLVETTSVTPDCHCHECEPSGLISLERTRYYVRQLVGPDDLTQDQIYFREKHRRHNRLLHGWGIVCGARVRALDEACKVAVEPGYVLGPWGDEIVIETEVTIDACREGVDGFAVCGDGDPWCSDVRSGTTVDELYLAVRHAECRTRPVRVSSCACGCDESECEYSRFRDGYVFKVLTELPPSHVDREDKPEYLQLLGSLVCAQGEPRVCPPCPPDPWVVLAQLTIDDDQVSVTCDPYRRYAVSFARYGFHCRPSAREGLEMLGRSFGMMSRAYALIDETAETPTPAGTAVLNVEGRYVAAPATIAVEPGDTMADVVERNRNRRFLDPATGDAYAFPDLVAAAGVPLDTSVSSPLGALAELEGRRLDVSGLRAVRERIAATLSPEAVERLETEHGGSPAAAADLPATSLGSVLAESPLHEIVGEMTVGDLGRSPRDEVEALIRRRARGKRRDEALRDAERVWEDARAVARLSDSWREHSGGGR